MENITVIVVNALILAIIYTLYRYMITLIECTREDLSRTLASQCARSENHILKVCKENTYNQISIFQKQMHEEIQGSSICNKTAMERILGELNSIKSRLTIIEERNKDEPRPTTKKTSMHSKDSKPKSV